MEFVFIRHGQSEHNAHLTTDLDSAITPAGAQQAKELGKWLNANWPSISTYEGLCSPYLRCLQTARILKEECGLRSTVDPGPMEIRIGFFQPEVPCRVDEYRDMNWDLFPEPMKLGRETMEEFMARMQGFLDTFGVKGRHPGKSWWERWVVISHGTPCETLAELAAGIYRVPTDFDKMKNCSLSWVDQGEIVYFNKVVYGDHG